MLAFYGAFITTLIIFIQIYQNSLKVGVFIHLYVSICAYHLALENDP